MMYEIMNLLRGVMITVADRMSVTTAVEKLYRDEIIKEFEPALREELTTLIKHAALKPYNTEHTMDDFKAGYNEGVTAQLEAVLKAVEGE